MDSITEIILTATANSTAKSTTLATGEHGSVAVGCLWFLMIGFMFFAQHHVCDAYFVPAINVFVETMRESKTKCLNRWGEEAVAGATICALGCNGPELFTNLISLYTCSDAGIGVVVGSEIFNLLIIVGAAVMFAPTTPLQLERLPFSRDCLFYGISIALLFWFMSDKAIQFWESCVLLGAAVVYVVSVYFTTDVKNCIVGPDDALSVEAGSNAQKGKMHGIELDVKQVVHGRMADGRGRNSEIMEMKASAVGIMTDQEAPAKPNERGSVGFQMQGADPMLSNMLRYDRLKEIALQAEGNMRLEFSDGKFQHVTLICKAQNAQKRGEFLEGIKKYDNMAWIHEYDATIMGAVSHLTHALKDKDTSIIMKLLTIPEFIIDGMLRLTLFAADVKDPTKEGRWPLCFLGAMFWLAMFSFGMLEIATAINYNIPSIPTAFLGITVCAIGTSFPNAVASIIMATQNKPAAAIANALGSNVQNVFLAMALPWVIFQSFPYLDCSVTDSATGKHPPFEKYHDLGQDAAGLTEGIMWMIGTLVLVIVFVVMPGFCTLSKPAGYFLIAVYFVYLGLTSYETFSAE